jgi:hypothetical protein
METRRGVAAGVGWSAAAIAAYFGLILLIAGPAAKFINRLPPEALTVCVCAFGLSVVLSLAELGFRAIDGPFPTLPGGVEPVNLRRRRLYPWMGGAAALVLLLAISCRFTPDSWHENWWIATFMAGLFFPVVLWFLHYKARRFDYGRTALRSNYWIHWSYPAGELEAFAGLDATAVPETWMGPDGLLYAGEYAPWALSIYKLVVAEAAMDRAPRINFTFKQTSFGDATSQDVLRVAIPEGHAADLAILDRELRALCPRAKIDLAVSKTG